MLQNVADKYKIEYKTDYVPPEVGLPDLCVCDGCERSEACGRACLSSHLHHEWDVGRGMYNAAECGGM